MKQPWKKDKLKGKQTQTIFRKESFSRVHLQKMQEIIRKGDTIFIIHAH